MIFYKRKSSQQTLKKVYTLNVTRLFYFVFETMQPKQHRFCYQDKQSYLARYIIAMRKRNDIEILQTSANRYVAKKC